MGTDETIVELLVGVAEMRKDVCHMSTVMDQMRREFGQMMIGQEERIRTLEQTRPTWSEHVAIVKRVDAIESVSDQRKPMDVLLTGGLTTAISIMVSWIMTRGG